MEVCTVGVSEARSGMVFTLHRAGSNLSLPTQTG
jgi:hypothetical protein